MRDAKPPTACDPYAAFLLLELEFPKHTTTSTPTSTSSGLACFPSAVTYQPPRVDAQTLFVEMPWRLLHASLWQVHANLLLLLDSNDPECVHQARIGWRRLRGTTRLLQGIHGLPEMPNPPAFEAVIDRLRGLRDLDVARLEVLPHAAAQAVGMPANEWNGLIQRLDQAAAAQRVVLQKSLQNSEVGQAMWQQVLWLAQLRDDPPPFLSQHDEATLCEWARARVTDIHHRFAHAQKRCQDEETQHRARIWAKRLRYATEDLKHLLGKKAVKWLEQARWVQSSFGAQRDLQMAAGLAREHGFPQLVPHILEKINGK
jgi:CHAD domain-containing protein